MTERERIIKFLYVEWDLSQLLIFGISLGLKPLKYFYNGIIDRFNKKLVGWKGAILSQARKCTLVKSNLQNLPTYALSLFGILAKYVDKMEKI